MKESQHFITLNRKRYPYSLKKINKKESFVRCDGANIAQEFLNEDIPALLNDLPHLILAEKKYHKQRDTVIRFRVASADKKIIEKKALERGYDSVSKYLRDLVLRDRG